MICRNHRVSANFSRSFNIPIFKIFFVETAIVTNKLFYFTNAELTRRVAELEAKDRTRDTRLSAIEKLLQSSSTVIALPAKPATASGQQ